MTLRDFILAKLQAFEISEAQLADIDAQGYDLDADVNPENKGLALIAVVEELLFAPRRTNINENGFSVSWDYDNLDKYYLWLCRKYGVTPAEELTAMLNLNVITDRTNDW